MSILIMEYMTTYEKVAVSATYFKAHEFITLAANLL